MIVRGPGARPIQGRSTRGSTLAAPGLPRTLLTHIASRGARPPEELRSGPSGSPSAHCRGGARVRGHDNQAETPPSVLTTKDSSSTATCRSRPLPPFDRRECRAPVNRGSAIDVGDWTGPERGASPEARCRAACQTRSPAAGVQAAGNGPAFDWLSRARRAPSDFPSPVAPPPSCELVAPRGRETRERSAGAGLALASQELDSRSTPPGLGSCGCVGR